MKYGPREFRKSKRANTPGERINVGTCARCKIVGAKLMASIVLEAEVCARCLVAGAAGEGWLRESDVRLLPGAGTERGGSA